MRQPNFLFIATLYRLVPSGDIWVPDTDNGWSAGRSLNYTDGSGEPDAEGVTHAEDGDSAIYVAAERDNDADDTSRLSVLRYTDSSTATHEWNLTATLPTVAANRGLEGITWLPDTFLTAETFYDEQLIKTYDPLDYPNHGTGLFALGLEGNGMLYVVALNHDDSTVALVAIIASGEAATNGLDFDRETGYLWTYCGKNCANIASVFAVGGDGRFALGARLLAPEVMTSRDNEGFAVAPEASCETSEKPVYWADDANIDGHALLKGAIPCGEFLP
jgi:hypothetical protein